MAMTSPNRAAKTIEKGIRKARQRILIGPDARLVVLLQKWFPISYPKIFNTLMGVNKLISSK